LGGQGDDSLGAALGLTAPFQIGGLEHGFSFGAVGVRIDVVTIGCFGAAVDFVGFGLLKNPEGDQ
jgi:hypothetical protein